jgi:galactokinase
MSADTGIRRDSRLRQFEAPARVNIIGEHTDYNDGFVLPTNTALYTRVFARPRDDRRVRVATSRLSAEGEFDIDAIQSTVSPSWLNYIKGVAAELTAVGIELGGIDLSINGDIPMGAGLSSSASLELAVARAMLATSGYDLDTDSLARVCRQAEIRYAGVNCGIMDQYSIAAGRIGSAMLLDCRTLESDFAQMPANLAFILVSSGVKHQLPDSGYNDRADECRQAISILDDRTIASLRFATIDRIEEARDQLGEVLFRRCRHVVTENQRTEEAFAALKAADGERLGGLISESHRSLRDDFEVSCDAIETLVGMVDECAGVKGSRMVGGGFGGCILAVTDAEAAGNVVEQICESYGKVIGGTPWTHVVAPAEAAREVVGP